MSCAPPERARAAIGSPAETRSPRPSSASSAQLAIQGKTNRQIAETLFVTRKTIESHLEHVFRKLGIHTRGELEAALTAEGELAPVH